MAIEHYENFPVGSWLLPARLRRPVHLIYAFARRADDFADEGDLQPAERLRLLAGFGEEIDRIACAEPARDALFEQLGPTIEQHQLSLQLFRDLLSAFSQDVVKARYADFTEVLDYCARSANPIGRLLLELYGHRTAQDMRLADQVCSSLQIINFLQDVAIDYRKDRIYMPQDEMARFGVTEAHIAAGRPGGNWHPFFCFQCDRARAMLEDGAPLTRRLGGRLGLELRLILEGGRRILDKLGQVQGDVFGQRPVLGRADWAGMLWRMAVRP